MPALRRALAMRSTLRRLRDLGVSFELDANGAPVLVRRVGPGTVGVVVISLPKAGTYLVAALLERLGWVDTHAHLGEDSFSDYRDRTRREMVEDFAALRVALPLEHSLRLVRPGQFAVGHLPYRKANVALLKPYRKLFVCRELRAALVSWMRFSMNKGRGEQFGVAWKAIARERDRMAEFLRLFGPTYLGLAHAVSLWLTSPAICALRYETLMGDHGETEKLDMLEAAARYLGAPQARAQLAQAAAAVVGKETKTWSGRRSSLEGYWDERCEQWFEENGGVALNAVLGYEGRG